MICEDAPAVVITWDLRAPEGARGPYRGPLRRERDRQILIVIMGSDVPRSWHVYASRFEAALATRTAAEAESKSVQVSLPVAPGPLLIEQTFFSDRSLGSGRGELASVTKTFLMAVRAAFDC